MFVVTPKKGEVITINTGTELVNICIAKVGSERVRLLIDAPKSVRIQAKIVATGQIIYTDIGLKK